MDARHFIRRNRAAALLAITILVPAVPSAWAGGVHGSGVFRAAAGVHGGRGGFAGVSRAGFYRVGGVHGLPPVTGVIHERPGVAPYVSVYGHTNRMVRPGIGAVAGGLRRYGRFPYRDRLRFAAARRGFGFGGVGAYGGYDSGGFGTYGAPGLYGDAGTYGGQGTYGGVGTYATQSIYGTTPEAPYVSETPLAARFAEPPLAPSPYAPYSPFDAYADSANVGSGPRVVSVNRSPLANCDCGSRGRAEPVVYRYGIGTAD